MGHWFNDIKVGISIMSDVYANSQNSCVDSSTNVTINQTNTCGKHENSMNLTNLLKPIHKSIN